MAEAAGILSIRAGTMDCWQCGCETTIVTGFDLRVGAQEWNLTVADFDAFPDLFEIVRALIPSDLGIGAIEARHSRTMGCAYLSNGCAHCNALLGQHFEHDAWDDQRTIAVSKIPITERWALMAAEALGD